MRQEAARSGSLQLTHKTKANLSFSVAINFRSEELVVPSERETTIPRGLPDVKSPAEEFACGETHGTLLSASSSVCRRRGLSSQTQTGHCRKTAGASEPEALLDCIAIPALFSSTNGFGLHRCLDEHHPRQIEPTATT